MTVPKNASFDPIDGCYKCECGQLLRLNAGLGYVISVNSCDSSVESVASYDEHVCSAKSQKRPAENYLQAQQKEIELQRELYGKFEPSGIFDKNREYQLKQQQLVSAQNRRREDAARKFLAQNSEQLEAEAQEKN